MQSLLASHHHIASFLLIVVRACIWLALMVAVFAPLEYFFAVRPAKRFHRDWATNLGWYFVNSLVPIFLLGAPLGADRDQHPCGPSRKPDRRDGGTAALGEDDLGDDRGRSRLLLGSPLEP